MVWAAARYGRTDGRAKRDSTSCDRFPQRQPPRPEEVTDSHLSSVPPPPPPLPPVRCCMGQVGVQDSSSMSLQRLLNSRMLELRRQFLPSPASGQDRSAHLRRNLFGPMDHEENLRFAQEEMDKLYQADCKRWNFDFQAEKPREGHYAWQAVREGVPETSNLPALTCCTSHATTCLTTSTSTHVSPTHATPSHTTSQTSPTNNKNVKRLHNKVPPKAAIKLCTDYFNEVKTSRKVEKSRFKLNSELLGNVKTVNTKLSEILKIQSTNTN